MSETERAEALAFRGLVEAAGDGVVEEVRGGVCIARPAVPGAELNRVVGVTTILRAGFREAYVRPNWRGPA